MLVVALLWVFCAEVHGVDNTSALPGGGSPPWRRRRTLHKETPLQAHHVELVHQVRPHVSEFEFHQALQGIHSTLREFGETGHHSLSRASMKMVNNQNTQYVAKVAVGSPQQLIPVILDTGSANLWVASAQCRSPECKLNGSFDRHSSSTFEPTRVNVKVKFGSGGIEGVIGKDTVHLGELAVPEQTFGEILVEHGKVFRNAQFAGLLGLGWPSLKSATPVFDTIIERNLLAKPMFSFYFTEYPVQQSVFVVGEPPASHYVGELMWLPLRTSKGWTVTMQDVYVNGKPLRVCGEEGCGAILDTGTTLITAPSKVAHTILNFIDKGHANSYSDPSSCEDFLNIHDSIGLPTVGFKLGGAMFQLEAVDYIRQHGDTCSPGIVPLDVPKPRGPLFILGDMFMRKYYAVFDKTDSRVGVALRRRAVSEDHSDDHHGHRFLR